MVDFFFFFQAEDGIRDRTVTGVQTCALPISDEIDVLSATERVEGLEDVRGADVDRAARRHQARHRAGHARSRERQIGRASCRERGWAPVVAGTLIEKGST